MQAPENRWDEAARQALLERRLRGEAAVGHDIRPGAGPRVLSPAQERLWFLARLHPESRAYHLFQAYRCSGALDPALLEAAVDHVVQRHEILRTCYPARDGLPNVELIPDLHVGIRTTSLASEIEAAAWARREVQRPFDLERGPLVRFAVGRLAADDHLLLVTMHHIVSDERSLELFWGEVGQVYTALSAGRPATMQDLPLQYADYARWQSLRDAGLDHRSTTDGLKHIADDGGDRHLEYWRHRLEDAPPAIALPADRPRPVVPHFIGGFETRTLPPELSHALRMGCREAGVSPFVFILAAFQVLLFRYSGQRDVNVGVPVTNRLRPEVEQLIGFFLNTLVLRGALHGELTFREHLARVRSDWLDALDHQAITFDRLVRELRPERRLDIHPFFQVMCVWRTEHVPDGWPAPLRLTPYFVDGGTSKFDLTLFASDGPDFELALEYDVALFERSTIVRMLEHLQFLLDGIAQNPDATLASLPMISPAEHEWLLRASQGPTLLWRAIDSVHRLIAEHAWQHPDAPALASGTSVLTYGELDREAGKLAQRLRATGIEPHARIGIFLERSPEAIVAMLAVLRAGGAYLPLDPSYPAERTRYMLEDARVPVVLTSRRLAPAVPATGARILIVDEPDDPAERHNPVDHSAALDAPAPDTPESNAAAYVIYTSGSSGRPKGTVVTHKNLVASTLARLQHYREAPERFLLLSSLSFDSSAAGIYWTLCTGGMLILPRAGAEKDVSAVAELLAKYRATHALALPSLYRLILEYAPSEALGTLRTVIVAGETCPASLPARHFATLPQTRLHNEYGPTEATVWATVHELAPARDAARVPIGRPIPGARVYVLDEQLQPVPIGVAGELFIGGPGVAAGYLNLLDRTAERFLTDPIRPGERIYRTGDLGRWRSDGVLEFLGRADKQVKIRGYRIEPDEIAAALRQHSSVRDCAVVAHPPENPTRNDGEDMLDTFARSRLVTYVVPANDARADSTKLREHLRARLPAFMVPDDFVFLESLPRTPNGKLDVASLPAPSRERRLDAPEPPRTPTEEKLAAIWSDVLRLDRVSVHDNFFEIGGDSITSIRIVSLAAREGLKLTAADVVQHPTIAGLAAVADHAPSSAAEAQEVSGAVPLTPIHQWFFDQDFARPEHWNQSIRIAAPADLDSEIFRQALLAVIRHHDALRLRFRMDGDGWMGEIVDPDDVEVEPEWIEIPDTRSDDHDTVYDSEFEARMQQCIHLDKPSILYYALVRRENKLHILLSVHHLLVDAVSWPILLEDLQWAYDALRSGRPVSLPAKTTSFKRWAEALIAFAESDEIARDESYWRDRDDAFRRAIAPAAMSAPVDGSRPTEGSIRTLREHLTREETRDLFARVPERYAIRTDELLLTALASCISDWSGRSVVRIDVEGHGREDIGTGIDVSRTVGWFTSVYPVVLTLPENRDPESLLRSVKEQLRRVPHRGLSYGLLRYVRGTLNDDLPADVLFNFGGRTESAPASSAILRPIGPVFGSRAPENACTHALELDAFVQDGCLEIRWSFAGELIAHESARRLASEYVRIVRELLDHCLATKSDGYTPSDFPDAGLSQEALDRLLDRFSG